MRAFLFPDKIVLTGYRTTIVPPPIPTFLSAPFRFQQWLREMVTLPGSRTVRTFGFRYQCSDLWGQPLQQWLDRTGLNEERTIGVGPQAIIVVTQSGVAHLEEDSP